ncbi:MAG TPA: ribose ABC transporter substrate-binding protein, partial [Fastidiosipila sp.]|nr:ribose ABC transporter substrate-binding protein [Fastidiosipila sp.]
ESVDAVVRALNGETLDEFIDSGVEIIDESNAQERLDLLQSYLD